METERKLFLGELGNLLKKYKVPSFFFYGVDADGKFGDFDISDEEAATMILAILSHEHFTNVAKRIEGTLAQGLGKPSDINAMSEEEEFKWTWKQK